MRKVFNPGSFAAILRLVQLEGWNHIPDGFGAQFVLEAAPWWLRTWFRAPFVDRFAYPILVRRGCGILTRHPSVVVDEDVVASARTAGWRFA
jgi:hypothetical protein